MFIKNKIMVSLKKYIIKWLKILQTPIGECKLNCVKLQ